MPCDPVVFTLGHSPDPDDAFMFYAMAKNKIDLRGYRFEHRLEDIQTLNERALRGELHISAIWANGGEAKPDCRCRSVEMCCAKTFRIRYGTTSFRSCDKASTTALPTAVRQCATHYHTPATWRQSSPESLSGCMSTITPGITAMPGARRFVNSLAMHTPPDTSTIKSRLSLWNNGNSLANYFFGSSAF